MGLHINAPVAAPGFHRLVNRGDGMKHLSFAVLHLDDRCRQHRFESRKEELAISFYGGPARIEAEGEFGKCSADVPPRGPYRDPHPMAFIPAGARVTISALDGEARMSIAGALGKPGGRPALAPPYLIDEVGRDNWARTVYTHIGDNMDAAHLVAGETASRPGGWTSSPPHKHDAWREGEVPMEEIYHFHFEPRQGFGMIRVYTDPDDPEPFDEPCVVHDGDTVLIPRGYHPVVACPGYTVHYAWILAGEGRKYGAWTDDPRHAWIKRV